MKALRQSKILELIKVKNIGTQEELSRELIAEGFKVTQATVCRDIKELNLTKVSLKTGGQKYVSIYQPEGPESAGRYALLFKEGFVSMDHAQNILVIKTVPGMAMAIAAVLDAMNRSEIVGSIAGDDTIMCAIRTVEETKQLMESLQDMMDHTYAR